MKEDELDRILLDEEILPSSGFTSAVMDTVRREAAMPPPIAFPWKRALPGLAIAALILVLVLVAAIVQFSRGAETPEPLPAWAPLLGSAVQAILRTNVHWVLGALLVSYACVKLAMRVSGHRV